MSEDVQKAIELAWYDSHRGKGKFEQAPGIGGG